MNLTLAGGLNIIGRIEACQCFFSTDSTQKCQRISNLSPIRLRDSPFSYDKVCAPASFFIEGKDAVTISSSSPGLRSGYELLDYSTSFSRNDSGKVVGIKENSTDLAVRTAVWMLQ